MSGFKTPEFRRLRGQFYRKLKASGFRDIENEQGYLTDHQTQYDFEQRIQFRPGLFEENRDYFIWAEHMVNLALFESAQDRKIWILHAQGVSSHEIAGKVKCSQTWASRKIRTIRKYLIVQDAILIMLTDCSDE